MSSAKDFRPRFEYEFCRVRLWGVALLVVVVGAGLATYVALTKENSYRLPANSIVMAMMLTALPLLICYVQTISLQRRMARLDTLQDWLVSNTSHFKIAYNTLR
ncbi:hypothetical protein SAMN05216338_1001338 [Bradyrhizobium sp. Rc2d]|uniref:hypothetical protein n=1 Tax=Bradyrhizobium sp. Rc2d TaxID=1855321 RepID=UPI000881F68E|nr:hypothetical protein [Bradyrhizobium sp. Rc2d]SDG44796.1 hypothetical protein SAMN05216338_1001338 [Bradyrhizobium sp. Rc2d]